MIFPETLTLTGPVSSHHWNLGNSETHVTLQCCRGRQQVFWEKAGLNSFLDFPPVLAEGQPAGQ